MASEEPPSIRHLTPQDANARLNSAPPTGDMSAAIDRLPSTTGQDDELTSETGGPSAEQDPAPSVVKTEPQSGASQLQTVPAVSSDVDLKQHEEPPKKEEDKAADLPLSDPPKQPENITLDNVRKAADATDLTKLEPCIEIARQVLSSMRQPMVDSKQRDQQEWLRRIDALETKSQRLRTVVAVAGATGAGKSSLINALLDEEKLLPTSGFRACTSVITEMSYNESDDPKKAYRAEVEFISQEDWDSELDLLLGDLVEDKQLSSAYLDTNAEAGIAYAKIKSVYPDLTHDMIIKSKVEQLAKRPAVTNVLGKTREIACSNARDLYTSLQKYLDSKDKDTKGGPRKEKDMAYWPLIKVVKVYTRAVALETGVCIVDLPGIHDANAARSAVARKYMAECSAVWIAAPIKRAVDDEAARKLLGMSSRLQMKLDGIYSNVTFICTMTDAVQLQESVEAFDEDGQIQAIFAREDDLEKMISAKKESISQLGKQVTDCDATYQELEKEIEAWKALQKKQKKGQPVYPPRIPAKRKRATAPAKRRRRQEVVVDDSDQDDTAGRNPLTADEISSKLTDLEDKAASKGAECDDMEERLQTMKNDLTALEDEKQDIAVESRRQCVLKRNAHVKKAIQVDFANGIREIDEADAQADDETFDPSIKKRDYDEVGRSLPVFCVSSKAYQQLRTQTKRETRVEGFRNLTDSEIPLLQQHAIKLPEQGRIHVYKTFLNEFCGLLGSLTIWANSSLLERNAEAMSEQDQSYEVKVMQAACSNMKKRMNVLILDNKTELDNIIHTGFESKSNTAITSAGKEVLGIVSKWPVKKDEGGYGLIFSTYRAICRHKGEKTKSDKSRNFNDDILEPYLKKIAASWEQAFGHTIPNTLDALVTAFEKELNEFHKTMSSRPELEKCKMASLKLLGQQITTEVEKMRQEVIKVKKSIQEQQREASRTFRPEIQSQMKKPYELIENEKGKGCFLRMKAHMTSHVQKNKNAIYRNATKRVMAELKKIFESNRKELQDRAHEIVDRLEGDFRIVISSSEMIEASEVAREHIRSVLCKVDAQFKEPEDPEPMEVAPVQPPEREPQQLADVSMADVGATPGEAVEAGPTGEAGEMDTTP
ncbi:hypothetical protein SLS63_004529 [Diaporthe eres]|uniref:Tat pathway signal sequence n=1 Tax=Diaporthe eres TaxID=83184 RepID=A0ABR1PDJ1_DIAER